VKQPVDSIGVSESADDLAFRVDLPRVGLPGVWHVNRRGLAVVPQEAAIIPGAGTPAGKRCTEAANDVAPGVDPERVRELRTFRIEPA
jgi:hypothetical protein